MASLRCALSNTGCKLCRYKETCNIFEELKDQMHEVLAQATPTTSEHEYAAQWLHEYLDFDCRCGYCKFKSGGE